MDNAYCDDSCYCENPDYCVDTNCCENTEYCEDTSYCETSSKIAELVKEIEQYKKVIYNAQNAMESAEEELQTLLYQENLNAAKNSPYVD